MTAQVVKFRPKNYADNPDNVLEEAVGVFESVLVIGFDKDGEMDARGSISDGGGILWLIECFKHKLIAGEYT